MDMTNVPVKSELLHQLGDDAVSIINHLVEEYLEGKLIRKKDIAGIAVAADVYKESFVEQRGSFDSMTKQFKGIVLRANRTSEAVFVVHEKLKELIEDNQVILVMKSPRIRGISLEEAESNYLLNKREVQ